MKKVFFPAVTIPLLLTLLVSPGSGAEKETRESAFSPEMDRLERQLEMKRHEELTKLKGQESSRLTEFRTDGCSGGLSVGWEYLAAKIPHFQEIHGDKPPWESCCTTHDRVYHSGGPRQISVSMSFEARKKADLALESCVLESGEQPPPELMETYNLSAAELEKLYRGIASMMYRAVRIGGMPCTGLPWRWGYGWPECQ
ncbi:MAG: hypothetical protein ABFR63_08470 [Thermodesulfobacteriota bacterium]